MEEPERRGRGRGRGRGSRGRPRGRPRGSHRGGRGSKRNINKIESEEEEEVVKQQPVAAVVVAVADENVPPKPIPNKYDADCDISSLVAPTFTTLDQGPPAPMLRLTWDNPVNLIGEKVLSPRIHICDTCNKPVLIYGRMIPCKHVFCLLCAKGEDRVCARCGERVSRVEQTGLGSVYMCPLTANKAICKRTYLSQRDLQAHIDHRHMKVASAGKQKEEVKEDRLNHRDPRAGGGAGAADTRNHETAVRGPDPRQDLNRNDPRATKDSYDHGTYTGQQQFQGQDAGQFGNHPEGAGHGGNRGPPGARGHTGPPHHAGGHPSAAGGHHGPAGHHSGPGPRDHRDSGGHHGGGGHHARTGGGHSAGGGPPRGGPGTQASHHIPVMTSSRTNLITVPLQDPTDHNSGAAPFNSHPAAPQHPPSHMPPSHPPPSHSFNTPPPNQPPPHGPPPHSQPPPFSSSFNSNYNNQNPQYTFAHNPSGPPPQNPSNIPPIPYSGGPPHAGRPPPAGPPPANYSGRPPFDQQYSGNQWSTPPPQAGPPSHPPPSHPPPRPPPPHHQPPPNAQSGSYYGRKSF